MPSIRVGYGSDFVVKNQKIGIGTDDPQSQLDVRGSIKANFEISGVTTLSSYAGFIPQKQNIATKSTTVGFATVGLQTVGVSTGYSYYETETGYESLVGEFNTLSDDLIVDDGKIFEIKTTSITGVTTIGTQSYDYDTSRVSLGTLESISIQSHFTLPNGGIETRPENPIEGTVRFNDDLNTLEFYNGVEWRQFTVTGASGRAVFTGGSTDVYTMEYLSIPTLGNTQQFGELTNEHQIHAVFGSSTRGISAGGYSSTNTPTNAQNAIDYFTIASEGNSIDFGNLSSTNTNQFRNCGGCSSSTRGLIFAGGHPAYYDSIDYVEISTLGNGIDFGNQTISAAVKSSFSSPTRGFAFGGFPAYSSNIDVVTIASTGNATKFGDLSRTIYSSGTCANSIRGVWGGGYRSGSEQRTEGIQYITMASEGNSIDFGDLSVGRNYLGGSSNQTRGVFLGGVGAPGAVPNGLVNLIDYITIASAGNAVDFGDSTKQDQRARGTSDSHGGLGGF